MKRVFAVVLILLFILSACDRQPVQDPTTPSTTETVPATEPTVPEQPDPAFADYVYRYEDERNSLWEQDVVYFAKLYLGEHVVKGHPLLTARLISIMHMDNSVTQRYFYNEQLRESFISQIHGLIDRLPELTDNQIAYELRRIVAILGDAHSQVIVADYELFPLVVEPMEDQGQIGLFVTRIPLAYENLLFSRLVSINGIPVEDVMARLRPFVPTENEHWADYCITSIYSEMLLAYKAALQAAAVMGQEDTARFCFEKVDGTEVEVNLSALDLSTGEYWRTQYADATPFSMGFLSSSQHGYTSYFYKYLELYDTMYLRLYDCSSEAGYRLEELLGDVDQELRVIGAVDKIVVDIRGNPGGYVEFVDALIEFLQQANTDDVYILIDNGSFSAATIFPSRARSKLDNLTIVGSHTGQTPNFFAGATSINLRKHDVLLTISTDYFEGEPGFEGQALAPDILVYQNVDDYLMRIDTVLQTVLDRP